MKRYVLRERRSPNKSERLFVLLELNTGRGFVGIKGICGYSLGKRAARLEEQRVHHDEVLLRSRRVYFVEGIGQITDQILDFFPEMAPFMNRHQQRVIDSDAAWLGRKFRRSREIAAKELEDGWA